MGARWADYVRDISRQSQPALARLYDESSALVYGLALRMLGHPAEAEGVTFDVYRCVWSLAGSYQAGQGSVEAWLVNLTRTRALDCIRQRGFVAPAAETQPAEPAVPNAKRDGVLKAIQQLTPIQRELLEAALFSGMGQRELSHHLRIPEELVKTEIRLAVVTLKELLTPLWET